MNIETYNGYYDRAEEAKKNGNYREAKILYMLAGESLIEYALEMEGKFKREFFNSGKDIIIYAKSLPVIESQSSQSEKKDTQSKTSKMTNKKDSKIETISNSNSNKAENDEMMFTPVDVSDTSFDDVAGLEEVKEAIRMRIIYPMQYPEAYEKFKMETGGGVLMYGPPGTGKTMIARAIAHEAGAKFYHVICSDIVNQWFGVAEKNIKNLFETARKHESAIIFFDEFHALSPKDTKSSSVMPRIVSELLNQMDGFDKFENTLLVLGATNVPWEIDNKIKRSGRFDEKIYVPLPDKEARKYIMTKKFKGVPIEDNLDFDTFALNTEGFSGADVAEFCNRSRRFALERYIKIIESGESPEDEIVTKEDIEMTLKNFSSTVDPKDLARLAKFKASST